MQFSFRDCPSWFNNYIVETFLDKFHEGADRIDAIKDSLTDPKQKDKLLDYAVDFFTANGLCVEKRERQLWFNIDENDPTYTWIILKWSE